VYNTGAVFCAARRRCPRIKSTPSLNLLSQIYAAPQSRPMEWRDAKPGRGPAAYGRRRACLEIVANDGTVQVLNFLTAVGIPALWRNSMRLR